MSYIDRHLMDGERVVFRTRLHWRFIITSVLVGVLLLAAGVATVLTPVPWVGILPAVLGLIVVGGAILRRHSSEFAVTDRRIVLKVGVLTTRSVEMLLSKIESVAVHQSLAGRMLGFGSIVVTGSGGTREAFDGIQSPLEFRNAVSAAADRTVDARAPEPRS